MQAFGPQLIAHCLSQVCCGRARATHLTSSYCQKAGLDPDEHVSFGMIERCDFVSFACHEKANAHFFFFAFRIDAITEALLKANSILARLRDANSLLPGLDFFHIFCCNLHKATTYKTNSEQKGILRFWRMACMMATTPCGSLMRL